MYHLSLRITFWTRCILSHKTRIKFDAANKGFLEPKPGQKPEMSRVAARPLAKGEMEMTKIFSRKSFSPSAYCFYNRGVSTCDFKSIPKPSPQRKLSFFVFLSILHWRTMLSFSLFICSMKHIVLVSLFNMFNSVKTVRFSVNTMSCLSCIALSENHQCVVLLN